MPTGSRPRAPPTTRAHFHPFPRGLERGSRRLGLDCRSVRLSVCLSICQCVCLCLSVCLVSASVRPFVSVSVYVCLSVYLSVCVRPSVCPFVCPSAYLSVCLSPRRPAGGSLSPARLPRGGPGGRAGWPGRGARRGGGVLAIKRGHLPRWTAGETPGNGWTDGRRAAGAGGGGPGSQRSQALGTPRAEAGGSWGRRPGGCWAR